MNSDKIRNKKGYVVISTVLVLLFVTLGISATLSFLSLGDAKTAMSFGKGEQTFFLSDACLEEGLLRLKNDSAYLGGVINFPEGECHIDIANSSDVYTIKSYFLQQEKYLRSLEAQVQVIDGSLQITSWGEKPFVIN